jgi:SPP1 gp7 family putative phage head morphogenesis protein
MAGRLHHEHKQTQALIRSLTPPKVKPRKSSYVPAHPFHLEDYYIRQLHRRIADPLMRITWDALKPVVMAYRAPSERADDDDPFITAIGKARLRFAAQVDVDAQAQEAIDDTAPKVEAFSLTQQRKALRVLGVDTIGTDLFKVAARKDWTQTNVALIRSIPEQFFPDVQRHVISAVHNGMRHETLARKLREEILPLSRSRSALIARDQVSKYNGQLAKYQQKAVGIETYEWLAVHDRRTRETHLELDGTTQRWDNPPAIGHPGEPIQCRCVSIPIL